MPETLDKLEFETINTGIMGAEESDSIFLSKKALDKIINIREENNVPDEYSLRLGTKMGGCSGLSYIIGFDSELNDNDKLIEMTDLNLVIDRTSLFYLMGVTLDYIDDATGSGFVFSNPNNEKTCGCGGGGH